MVEDRSAKAYTFRDLPEGLDWLLKVTAPAPKLTRLLWISLAVWLVTIPVAVILADAHKFLPRLLGKVADGVAGAALAILVAGVLFDRVRDAASKRAQNAQMIERIRLQEQLQALWVARYSSIYQACADVCIVNLSIIVNAIFHIFRVKPTLRALELRPNRREGSTPYKDIALHGARIRAQLERLQILGTRLFTSGSDIFVDVQRVVEQSATELEEGMKWNRDADESDTRRSLNSAAVKLLLEDAAAAYPQIFDTARRATSSIREVDELHRHFAGTNLLEEPSETTTSLVEYALRLEEYVTEWGYQLEIRPLEIVAHFGDEEKSRLLSATAITKTAASMVEQSGRVYEELLSLAKRMSQRSYEGYGDERGTFLQGMEQSLDSDLSMGVKNSRKFEETYAALENSYTGEPLEIGLIIRSPFTDNAAGAPDNP
jgi:hypothetical protein